MPKLTAIDAPTKTAVIHLRALPETRDLIDRAADACGRSRTDFVLDAARRAAEEALLDRRLIVMKPADYDAFAAALDAPPSENPRLRELLETPDPWDRGEPG